MPGIVEDKVAIVTGAGRGIGRAIAMLMAEEGAKVLVNDVGAALDGSGGDTGPAQQVVDEIKKKGGQAIASTLSIGEPAERRQDRARPRSTPSAASTSSSTTPASCATRSSTA